MWDRPEQDPGRDEADLEYVIEELRADVPVRPEWRARLLRELAAAPAADAPGVGTTISDGTRAVAARSVPANGMQAVSAPVRWQVRPVTAIAAAMAFTVLGAAGALLASGRTPAVE